MMDPNEDPRTPHRIRHQLAREFLSRKYPGAHIQRVSTLLGGSRVEATVILENGQTINTTVPQVEERWY